MREDSDHRVWHHRQVILSTPGIPMPRADARGGSSGSPGLAFVRGRVRHHADRPADTLVGAAVGSEFGEGPGRVGVLAQCAGDCCRLTTTQLPEPLLYLELQAAPLPATTPEQG